MALVLCWPTPHAAQQVFGAMWTGRWSENVADLWHAKAERDFMQAMVKILYNTVYRDQTLVKRLLCFVEAVLPLAHVMGTRKRKASE